MANARKDLFDQWVESGAVENNLAILQSLAMQGKSLAEMAECFDISKRTLINLKAKHSAIDKAIKNGRLSVVAMCQNKLMERVSSGDTTAIIYALKVYGGEFFNDRNHPTTAGPWAGGQSPSAELRAYARRVYRNDRSRKRRQGNSRRASFVPMARRECGRSESCLERRLLPAVRKFPRR